MVWDEQDETPATLGGKPLVGMNRYRAEMARNVLERIDATRLKPQRPEEQSDQE
jgi:hypothetical protein